MSQTRAAIARAPYGPYLLQAEATVTLSLRVQKAGGGDESTVTGAALCRIEKQVVQRRQPLAFRLQGPGLARRASKPGQ